MDPIISFRLTNTGTWGYRFFESMLFCQRKWKKLMHYLGLNLDYLGFLRNQNRFTMRHTAESKVSSERGNIRL